MSLVGYYKTLGQIEDRVTERMGALRQAEREVTAQFGMTFDGASAEEIYRKALDHCGISRGETAGLNAQSLRVLLKTRPTPGSRAWRDAPAMAYDTKSGPSPLDGILAGVKPPRDQTTRNDLRR